MTFNPNLFFIIASRIARQTLLRALKKRTWYKEKLENYSNISHYKNRDKQDTNKCMQYSIAYDGS